MRGQDMSELTILQRVLQIIWARNFVNDGLNIALAIFRSP